VIPTRRLQCDAMVKCSAKVVASALALFVVGCASGARQRTQGDRGERSLLNTFPFSANQQAGHHGDHHGDHHGHHQEVPSRARSVISPRNNLQGSGGASFAEVASADVDRSTGKRCIDKVEMVEETEYDELSSATTRMTRDVTPLTPPAMRRSKRKSATRTTEKTASLNTSRSPSTKPPGLPYAPCQGLQHPGTRDLQN